MMEKLKGALFKTPTLFLLSQTVNIEQSLKAPASNSKNRLRRQSNEGITSEASVLFSFLFNGVEYKTQVLNLF